MTVKVGINGFGRIGRNFLRALLASGADAEVVAVNDLTDNKSLAHLLKYDSILGRFPGEVSYDEESITVDGKKIRVFEEKDPSKLDWASVGARRRRRVHRLLHQGRGRQGAPRPVAPRRSSSPRPAKGEDITIVMGVNEGDYDPARHIISNASCTTNCLAPMAKVLNETVGIEKGLMTTIHAYTADQNLQDGPHSDLRRARAAALNIVPDQDRCRRCGRPGPARAQGQVRRLRAARPDPDRLGHRPHLRGVRQGDLRRGDQRRDQGRRRGPAQGHPVLHRGSDRVQGHRDRPHSCIFDAGLTKVIGNLVKVVSWYDNEWGYSNRLVDLVVLVGNKL
jgi:glyceraldehyde 3-phosphate dehydrogenase